MNIWRTTKVFISSTFKDLERERDSLASIFRDLQRHVFDKRLHVIPYDLRWQDQNNPNLVRWCLDKVLECDYFIGILSNRYGWRPPYNYSGEENKDNISITEMEVHCALESIPKQNRFFCFSESTGNESPEDIIAICKLKQYLKQKGEKIVYYSLEEDVQKIIKEQLQQMLDKDFLHVDDGTSTNYSYEDALEEIIAEKRRDFIGREAYIDKLKTFCQQQKENVLLIEGIAGSGKSALVSEFLYQYGQSKQLYVGHYISMHANKDMYTVMHSIASQLKSEGIIDSIEKKPVELMAQVAKFLRDTTTPFLLCVDGIDEMDNPQDFIAWFPRQISPQIHIVLTLRSGLKWELSCYAQKIFLQNMSEKEIEKVICIYKDKNKTANIIPKALNTMWKKHLMPQY